MFNRQLMLVGTPECITCKTFPPRAVILSVYSHLLLSSILSHRVKDLIPVSHWTGKAMN